MLELSGITICVPREQNVFRLLFLKDTAPTSISNQTRAALPLFLRCGNDSPNVEINDNPFVVLQVTVTIAFSHIRISFVAADLCSELPLSTT